MRIKSIETPKYEVMLSEVEQFFIVSYHNKTSNTVKHSEKIKDRFIANYMFEIALRELQPVNHSAR